MAKINKTLKITIEGLPGIGKTTLYNSLLKHYKNIIVKKSPDFVNSKDANNVVVQKIEMILKSEDAKFLTLDSPIGETLLLLARTAFKVNSDTKGIQISDKSIDTLISHAIPRLVNGNYFKNKDEAFIWINNILQPFYRYPDLTIFLRPRNLGEFLDKTVNDNSERNYLEQISEAYDFLYTKTNFGKRTENIDIDRNMTQEKVFRRSAAVIDKFISKHEY